MAPHPLAGHASNRSLCSHPSPHLSPPPAGAHCPRPRGGGLHPTLGSASREKTCALRPKAPTQAGKFAALFPTDAPRGHQAQARACDSVRDRAHGGGGPAINAQPGKAAAAGRSTAQATRPLRWLLRRVADTNCNQDSHPRRIVRGEVRKTRSKGAQVGNGDGEALLVLLLGSLVHVVREHGVRHGLSHTPLCQNARAKACSTGLPGRVVEFGLARAGANRASKTSVPHAKAARIPVAVRRLPRLFAGLSGLGKGLPGDVRPRGTQPGPILLDRVWQCLAPSAPALLWVAL